MNTTESRIDNRAFSVAALRAWNRLPTELKLLRLTTFFRHQLKIFFSSLPKDTEMQTDDCFVMHPRSSSRGRNTNTPVTQHITADAICN